MDMKNATLGQLLYCSRFQSEYLRMKALEEILERLVNYENRG